MGGLLALKNTFKTEKWTIFFFILCICVIIICSLGLAGIFGNPSEDNKGMMGAFIMISFIIGLPSFVILQEQYKEQKRILKNN